MAKIAVAVSGGVDSLCALLQIQKLGHSTLAIHGIFLADAKIPQNLEFVCRKAGAEFIAVDLREQFQNEVINYYRKELAQGRTPNPCAICNRSIKFGSLLKIALEQGADKLATGHYVTIDHDTYPTATPCKGSDPSKDQSYFLGLVQSAKLEKLIFPLGTQTKSVTRKIVQTSGYVPPLLQESQDICFKSQENVNLTDGSPGPILLRTARDSGKPVDQLPEIGMHRGLWHYTQGQRKGLRLPWREPLYVREIRFSKNQLVVSPRELLDMTSAILKSPNYFVAPEKWPRDLFARLRCRQTPVSAVIDCTGNQIKIQLKYPSFPTAPGQIGVIEDRTGHILAGGLIEKIFLST